MTDTIQQHFKQPTHCPYCGSGDIDGDSIEILGQVAEQRVRCVACGRPWWDRYHLRELVDDDEQLHEQKSGAVTQASLDDRDLRQRDLVPREPLQRRALTVIGVGAIGRQVALQFAAMGASKLHLVDPDTVEPVNLAPQGFMPADLGQSKVEATAALCQQVNPHLKVTTTAQRFRFGTEVGDAVFCCVDKIDIRRFIWRCVGETAAFFCDGRMSAEVVRVLTAADGPGRAHYPSTLFAGGEAHEGACTARSTIFTANIAAGLMLEQFSRWLRDLPLDADLQLNLLTSELTVT